MMIPSKLPYRLIDFSSSTNSTYCHMLINWSSIFVLLDIIPLLFLLLMVLRIHWIRLKFSHNSWKEAKKISPKVEIAGQNLHLYLIFFIGIYCRCRSSINFFVLHLIEFECCVFFVTCTAHKIHIDLGLFLKLQLSLISISTIVSRMLQQLLIFMLIT